MVQISKPALWLTIAAYLNLILALVFERLKGPLSQNWSMIVFSVTLLTLALAWPLLVRMAKH